MSVHQSSITLSAKPVRVAHESTSVRSIKINSDCSLTKIKDSPCLVIGVSTSVLMIIRDRFERVIDDALERRTPSAIDLLDALRQHRDTSLPRPAAGLTQPLDALSMLFPHMDRDRIEDIWRQSNLIIMFLNNHRTVLKSCALAVRVSSSQSSFVDGKPTGALDFEHLREKVTRAIAAGPVASPHIRDWPGKIARARASLSALQEIGALHHRGHSASQIATMRRSTDMIVANYLRGYTPKFIALLIRASTPRARTAPAFAPPTEPNEHYAFFLGAYQAKSSYGGTAQGIFFKAPRKEQILALKEAAQRAAPRVRIKVHAPSDKSDSPGWRLRINSVIEAKGLQALTSANRAIPFEALSTISERCAFLRGFLTLRGRFNPDGLVIALVNNAELTIQLATLCELLGVVARVRCSKSSSGLFLSSRASLRRLMQLDALPPHLVEQLLQRPGMNAEPMPLPTAEQYLRSIDLAHQPIRPPLKQIAVSVGAHPATVLEWLNNGTVPQEIKNLRELSDLKRSFQVSLPTQASTLFREQGLSWSDARLKAIAMRISRPGKPAPHFAEELIEAINRLSVLEGRPPIRHEVASWLE